MFQGKMMKTPMKHYCHVLLYSADNSSKVSMGSSIAIMLLEVAGIGIPVATLLINRRLYREFGLKNSYSSRSHTLQQRFALSNNVTVSLILLPLDILRSVAYIIGLTLLWIIRYTGQTWTPRAAMLSSLATFISVPLVCACPISCIYLDKRLRRAALDYIKRWRAQCGCHKGSVAPESADATPKVAVVSERMTVDMELQDASTCSQAGSGMSRPSKYKSVVADCVVDFKTNPQKAQDIVFQLWERQLR